MAVLTDPIADFLTRVKNAGLARNEKFTVPHSKIKAEIAKITGQKPSITYARKSVANFKLREGEVLGARVTLRSTRMWEFLDRFINITAPNIRDFRGLPTKSFDGRGNYAIGIPDQSIFPEIELDQIKRNIGFDIIFVTSAPTDDEGRDLLAELGIPFRKPNKKQDENA